MLKTIYKIKKMDCPSEQSIIELELSEVKDIKLEFDLENRILVVYHKKKDKKLIKNKISKLNFWEKILKQENVDFNLDDDNKKQKEVLVIVFLINFILFIVEVIFGIISNSMWLLADSLDMLSDASVYFISLLAVWTSLLTKKKIAKFAWYLQFLLAIIWLIEVIRRFTNLDYEILSTYVLVIASLSLIGNSIALYIFNKYQSNEPHIKASQICTSNDVIVNFWIILSAILVWYFKSPIPDLIIWTIVFALVINWAIKMIKLGK